MNREEAILHMTLRREELKLSVGDLDEDIKAFDMAIEALEQKPCEDAISRQAAIVRCKDCRKHNVSVGYTKDCCPLYEFRGISYGHEHDYQFCCFAERRTDERSD